MRSDAVNGQLCQAVRAGKPQYRIPRVLGTTLLVLSLIGVLSPFCAKAQLAGTGTIEGTVTDSTGAVVVGAQVSAVSLATGARTDRLTTKSGLYSLAPLDAGDYTVTISARGFEKLVRENIHVDGLQVLALNVTLQVGAASQTITVSEEPPPLETSNATLGATLENQVYQSLPLEMGGANGISTDQRRATDSAILMPGVSNNETKNNESDEPMVINGNANSTEMYIEGLPFESASVSGDPRYIWSAISVEAVDQFQVKTTAYSAEYQGLGVENFTIKSGTNQIHGSFYENIRNTAFDSAGFNPAQYPTNYPIVAKQSEFYKPPEHMNEYGMTIGGPIWKNKIFVFGNYMGFRFSALTSPQTETIPTQAELCGDFSSLPNPIYDPTTQTETGGSYSRTQFSGPSWTPSGCGTGPVTANVIPQGELSPQAKYLQQYWAGVDYLNSNPTNNYQGSYNYGLNNWSTTDRLDVNLSDRHKMSVILAAGRQGLIGPAGSQTTQVGPLPYLYSKTYAPVTRVAIFQDTFLVSQNLVNQFNYGIGQYHAPDNNVTLLTPAWSANAAGISNLASSGQAPNSFPIVKFSGTDDPAQWGPNTGQYVQSTNTDSLKDNVQWVHGKHTFTFGGQFEWLEFNDLYAYEGSTPLTLSFAVTETAQVSGSSASATKNTGLAYASYLLGAVDSSSYTEYAPNAQETGSRYHPFAVYANDDWKLTPKLTLNAGLRWDVMPPFREVENRFSFLNPTMTNPVTGTPGALQFAGGGTDGCNCETPMNTYYKDWGPRLGAAYALGDKTVIRAAYGIYYAHGGGTSGGATTLPASGMELGFSAVPNPPSPGDSLPAFYLNNSNYNSFLSNSDFGGAGYTVTPPPIYDPQYATYYSTAAVAPDKISSTVSYLDPKYGGRTPTFEGWSFGVQRLLTKDITATVSYVGNQGHFLVPTGVARGYWGNQLNPAYLSLGSTVLGTKNPTSATMPAGTSLPYATYGNNGTVSQALVAFPQYSGVTDQVAAVGNANYNALQLSIVQRLSRGITFMLNYTYSKTIDDIGTFRTGYAIPAGILANSGKPWPIDRIERSRSVQDQPQNLVATSTYDLPFGRGHWGDGSALVRAVAGGWRLSSIFSLYSGDPLTITSGTCTGTSGQGTCMPAYNTGANSMYPTNGPVRQNGGWGHGATRNSNNCTVNCSNALSAMQYINPAAFVQTGVLTNTTCTASGTACNGMVLGDVARTAPYGLRGPGNYDIDGDLRRTFDLWKEGRVKFIFDASVFNAVNHVWFGSASSTADGSIGSSVTGEYCPSCSTVNGSPSLGVITGQANSPRQWQFAGRFTF
jgi:Carboxypeptidase regulatory-like domain